jgi:hypothetical protein
MYPILEMRKRGQSGNRLFHLGALTLESDHHQPKPKNTTLSEQGRVFYVCPFLYSVNVMPVHFLKARLKALTSL